MSKELIERLRAFAPYASPNAADLMHEAADALEAKAAPVAYITGQFAGRCVIEAINRAAVLPTGMALYSHPQPSAGVMPERKTASDYPNWGEYAASIAEEANTLIDEFARLNGKEVGRG